MDAESKNRALKDIDAEIREIENQIEDALRSPSVGKPHSDDGVSEASRHSLNDALGRSLSTDIREQLRDRRIDVLP